MTTTDYLDALEWFDREADFAIDEWRRGWPEDAMAGLRFFLPRLDDESDFDDAIESHTADELSNAAEFLACYRDRTLTPVRQRVIEYLAAT